MDHSTPTYICTSKKATKDKTNYCCACASIWRARSSVAHNGALTHDSRLEVNKHGAGNVFPGARLTEEGVEGVISTADGFVGGHLPVWLYAMLQTVELPTSIANLNSSLPNVDGDTLTLRERKRQLVNIAKGDNV